MTRAELYDLVWGKPVTQVAQDFGISDVAIRKICIKHNIPTPPLGYWAKIKHGKIVIRPTLPALKSGESDVFKLEIRKRAHLPPEIAKACLAAQEELDGSNSSVIVPDARPVKLHSVAIACEKNLRKAKPNHEGFIEIHGRGLDPFADRP